MFAESMTTRVSMAGDGSAEGVCIGDRAAGPEESLSDESKRKLLTRDNVCVEQNPRRRAKAGPKRRPGLRRMWRVRVWKKRFTLEDDKERAQKQWSQAGRISREK
ncbi:hypothetical protein WN48_03399 [Eufriesea mexicana]|uniref:Uncharacterized protein n=1 Tax=Eufriesea mexicana TaxID=516756 RepID=A0A310SPN5_9HYME|nr:hypothetical protein WN48_03399 [Eufriesea mexicana]